LPWISRDWHKRHATWAWRQPEKARAEAPLPPVHTLPEAPSRPRIRWKPDAGNSMTWSRESPSRSIMVKRPVAIAAGGPSRDLPGFGSCLNSRRGAILSRHAWRGCDAFGASSAGNACGGHRRSRRSVRKRIILNRWPNLLAEASKLWSDEPSVEGVVSEHSVHLGRCFCGVVELAVTGKPEVANYCHCASCREWGPHRAGVGAGADSAGVQRGGCEDRERRGSASSFSAQ
jgi:hypothetical protein